jgi:hypothetical protein
LGKGDCGLVGAFGLLRVGCFVDLVWDVGFDFDFFSFSLGEAKLVGMGGGRKVGKEWERNGPGSVDR